MRCTVLFFAQLAEALGTRQIELDLPAGSTVRDALDALAREHEAIESMRDRIAVAVDETYSPPETVLPERCTLALIPPVSGG
ncbi:MAG: molybdopterin converting factor subunit 1 [Planctomycetota bacterium]